MRVALAFIRKELAGIYSPEETDSLIFLIFERMKGYTRTQFLMAKDETLGRDETNQFLKIVDRLKKHEPIQYILGQTEFYGLPFYTPPGVLIPRGETEELVQWVIQENQNKAITILDIGTGTGCIAISLRKNILDSTVWACDISPVCLETAQKNAELNQAEVAIVSLDILNPVGAIQFPELDVIVSNPPYIRECEKTLMEKNVLEYEPELALFVPDHHPLLFYDRIADFALVHLKNSGKLYFEINEAFGNECVEMLRLKGFSDIVLKKDLHGKDRMIGCSFFKE
ncbi:MAG: peptide chain release factor N(5)-glutamine methyltransferase [Prolixibacteraceae bacterium]|nr:peptide chain release factor N(5)-glutamine methyltransferase [Prolixibacteraceae bacterium]